MDADASRRRLAALLDINPGFVEQLRVAQANIPELRPAFRAIRCGIAEAAESRHVFAERLRTWADALLEGENGSDDDMAARMAVARYYYSVHHLLRAACLVANYTDPGREGLGHESLSRAVAGLAAENRLLLAKLCRVAELGDKIGALNALDPAYPKRVANTIRVFIRSLHNVRKNADYDPLGTSDPKQGSVDFVGEARRLKAIAHSFSEHVGAFIRERCRREKEGA